MEKTSGAFFTQESLLPILENKLAVLIREIRTIEEKIEQDLYSKGKKYLREYNGRAASFFGQFFYSPISLENATLRFKSICGKPKCKKCKWNVCVSYEKKKERQYLLPEKKKLQKRLKELAILIDSCSNNFPIYLSVEDANLIFSQEYTDELSS